MLKIMETKIILLYLNQILDQQNLMDLELQQDNNSRNKLILYIKIISNIFGLRIPNWNWSRTNIS